MENTEYTENDIEENVWIHGKPVANLASSDVSMSAERKAFIQKALEYDIIDIRTYMGYKGDLLTEVTTMDASIIPPLKEEAEKLGMEMVYTKDVISVYKIYAISPSASAYDLKEE